MDLGLKPIFFHLNTPSFEWPVIVVDRMLLGWQIESALSNFAPTNNNDEQTVTLGFQNALVGEHSVLEGSKR